MNCQYEKSGNHIVAKLPERLAQWYKIETLSDSDYNLISEPDKTRVRLNLEPLIAKQMAAEA